MTKPPPGPSLTAPRGGDATLGAARRAACRRVATNPHLSSCHRELMEKQMRCAHSSAELKAVGEHHGPFLLGDDLVAMQHAYRLRLQEIYAGAAAAEGPPRGGAASPLGGQRAQASVWGPSAAAAEGPT